MKPGPLSIVATLALVTAGCGDGPGGDIVAPDTPENATGREDGRAIADTSTPEANSRSDQVYILIDRTCAHGVSYRYVRFASDEDEKWYRHHRGYDYVPVDEASSELRDAVRREETEPGTVYTYHAPL